MKTKLKVVKIGGAIIDDDKLLDEFLDHFSKIDDLKILIHGGGKIATQINKKLGIKTVLNEGRRITTDESIDTVTMVYAGLINKKIVAKLQSKNCNAFGLSGADGNCIVAKKRPIKPIDFGLVGDVDTINLELIQLLIQNKLCPVFSAICHDGEGQLLNTNADTISAEIAIAMNHFYNVELMYCFEKKGVLLNVEDDESVIKTINESIYSELKNKGLIKDGMLPKIDNSIYALSNQVSKVIIGGINLFTNETTSTTIKL